MYVYNQTRLYRPLVTWFAVDHDNATPPNHRVMSAPIPRLAAQSKYFCNYPVRMSPKGMCYGGRRPTLHDSAVTSPLHGLDEPTIPGPNPRLTRTSAST